jgi:dienelactone hydrolase
MCFMALAVALLLPVALTLAGEFKPAEGLWDVERIVSADTPFTIDQDFGRLKAIRYRGEPYHGRASWVFAYYAVPEVGKGPFPAMLLVHGGGGKAFPEWAQLWADRGYAALAMDLSGNGADGKLITDGGPQQDDGTKFQAFEGAQLKDMWPYQAVAAVLRGHAFLAAQKDTVDKDRIGVTGISWGGYLTCIVAGIDHQLKAAVPVYGCGFLADNSRWQQVGIFDRMTDDVRKRWLSNFDPSQYLAGVKCPILFINGTNDGAYPLDSYQRSYELVTSPRTLRVTVNMPHSHPAGWAPNEIGMFVDSVLKGGVPLARLTPLVTSGSAASTTFEAISPIARAQLHYTFDEGPWHERAWKSVAAAVDTNTKKIAAELPSQRPLVCFITVVDERGLTISTNHAVLGRP